MRGFEELISEAVAADVTGWDFGWLRGRALEERPPWAYQRVLAHRLPGAESALDLDTGGGEVLAGVPRLARRTVVTEGWPPNAERARHLLGPRGVEVVEVQQGAPLPFADGEFDLVTSRHPVDPAWGEIARVLAPGGTYLAQHVGPASAFELIEFFTGPLPRQRLARDPRAETSAARAAGLRVDQAPLVRLKMEFFDVGAVVWLLRRCVWWVPDFDVERYRPQLVAMDARIREQGSFVAHSTRTLFDARRLDRLPR
ncbi:SAM-dependent methyltransferase [Actinoplanes lutulentus]|uniref:Methyltransferase family protein n=1 Tax=Actinoplanes lutulentus TaxID=1287878 RepID=A0A327ZMH5_9ACTN|nr:class I SAM-dependent methyltransferase [Actinoplanes lutulentus]MBB2944545.1 SAM-dependent methyltransferase [Actinoplanes lutulentus]RAK42224.1 methyltransferase family protein [Actinoplanes lutulentus]